MSNQYPYPYQHKHLTIERHLLWAIVEHDNSSWFDAHYLVIAQNFNKSFRPYNKIIKKYKVLLFSNGMYAHSMYNQPFIQLWSLLETLKMPSGYKHPIVLSKNLKYLSIDYWFEYNMKCPKHIVFVSIRYNDIPHHLSKNTRGISASHSHATPCDLLPKKLVYLNIGHCYKHKSLPKGLVYLSFYQANSYIPIDTLENLVCVSALCDDYIFDSLTNSVKDVANTYLRNRNNIPNSIINPSYDNVRDYHCIDFKKVFACGSYGDCEFCRTYGAYFR